MKIIQILIYLIALLIGLNSTSFANVEDVLKKSVKLDIPKKYQINKSTILGFEPSKDSCGDEDKKHFDATVAALNAYSNKFFIVKSWKQLLRITKKEIASPLLKKLKPTDFDGYDIALIIIPFTGLEHIDNANLKAINGKSYFTYDVREWQPMRFRLAFGNYYTY